MTKRLPVQQVSSIPGAVGREVIASSVSWAGHALLLSVAEADTRRVLARDRGDGAPFSWTHVDPPYEALLIQHDGQRVVRDVELVGHLSFPGVQMFADGGILITTARCEPCRDGTTERNAHVYTPQGELVTQFTIGDGVEHVRVDRSDRIWAGYFDEGVYGGNQPVGASGIVCFDRTGEITWEYRPPADGPWIDDCYALNVGADETWTCFYSDFPIVRIKDGALTVWNNSVVGARALAVDGRRVLLVGGYKENAKRAVLLGLDGDQAVALREYETVLPNGDDIKDVRVLGVGNSIHFLARDGSWFRVDVRDLEP